MAEIEPLFLQAGEYTAAEDRYLLSAVLGADHWSSTEDRGGVVRPDALVVSAKGTPDMSVNVAAGLAIVKGTESTGQGYYVAGNDAEVNKSIAAADSTNDRHDLVALCVRDSEESGSDNDGPIVVVTGIPSASPADPDLPENAIPLARVVVQANASSITSGDIEDLRPFAPVTQRRIVARVRRVANQSINNSAETVIAFDTEDEDSAGMHSSGTFTIPPGEGGLYSCYVRWVVGAGANYTVVTAGGDTHVQVAGNPLVAWAHIIKWLEAGDTVQFRAAQNSGAAQNITAKAHVARVSIH